MSLLLMFKMSNERPDEELIDGFDETLLWKRLKEMFNKEYCQLHKIAEESPLLMIIKAALIAVPQMQQNEKLLGEQSDLRADKSYAVDLPPELTFHSCFVCPVLKEVVKENNPPVLLKCGHVISKLAVDKIKGTSGNQIKCPTCPTNSKLIEIISLNMF